MGRSSDARERLIEIAIALLWKQGFSSVSVDQLCDAAGVKKGSFYHFFASKEELTLVALETHWERRRPVLDEIFSASLPPLERLRRYFRHVHQRQCDVREEHGRVLGCFFFSLGTANLENPRLIGLVRDILGTYERYYSSTLVEAERSGAIQLKNPEAKARALFQYIEGLLADARLHDSTAELERLPELGFEFLGLDPSGSSESAAPWSETARRADA